MDDLFSNINLFKFLQDYKYGACGTVRANSFKFPNELKVKKKKIRIFTSKIMITIKYKTKKSIIIIIERRKLHQEILFFSHNFTLWLN